MALANPDFNVRKALANSLESICDEETSSFYAKGTIGEINPGLHIDGVGSVGMPISEHDVQRMISVSRQAPFGKAAIPLSTLPSEERGRSMQHASS